MRHSDTGDALWVARSIRSPGEVWALDFVVERKGVHDLVGSIKQGRYEKQKYVMRRCGLRRVMYLVEGLPEIEVQGVRAPSLTDLMFICRRSRSRGCVALFFEYGLTFDVLLPGCQLQLEVLDMKAHDRTGRQFICMRTLAWGTPILCGGINDCTSEPLRLGKDKGLVIPQVWTFAVTSSPVRSTIFQAQGLYRSQACSVIGPSTA